MQIPFPDKKYSIVYADPHWEVNMDGDWPCLNKRVRGLPYQTMPLDEIRKMPLSEITEKDAHLYLWTINKYIEQSYQVARDWGFKPVTLITWCKQPMGMGLCALFFLRLSMLSRDGDLSIARLHFAGANKPNTSSV